MDAYEFANLLGAASGKLERESFKDPLEQAARSCAEFVGDNFQRQQAESGESWLPHAPLTIKLHGEHPLLRLTWTMYAAATNIDDPKAKKIIGDREIVFGIDGTEIPYARTQQSGEGRVPAREFFYVRDEDMLQVMDVFAEAAMPIINQRVFA
ncbi:MAG: hypothetical protein NXI32_22910 [bacterium]|nr:hypothetical protein [bacterium]